MFATKFQCPDCGGSEAYRSRRRTLFEKYVLPLLCLQPVRCGNCFRRSNTSTFVPVRERREKTPTAHAA